MFYEFWFVATMSMSAPLTAQELRLYWFVLGDKVRLRSDDTTEDQWVF